MNPTDTITRVALSEALSRCCDQHPASDNHHQLHPDASLMADLLGMMLHHRQTSTATADINQAIIDAFHRWA